MILVTGASGFVGRHAVSALLAQGHAVRACVHRRLVEFPAAVERIVMDDAATMDWQYVLDGVTCVLHLAGHAHVDPGADRELQQAFHRVNVMATRNLAQAALQAAVSRFVFVSSIGVHGTHTEGGQAFSEADMPAPKDAYAVSKWEAEQALSEACERRSMQQVVIRPALVAGAGAPGNLARLASLVRKRIPLPVREIHNRRTLVGVHSLARLLAIACLHPRAAGKVFVAADPPGLSTAEIVTAIAEGMGRTPSLVGVPAVLLQRIGRLVGQSRQVARLCESLEVDAGAARAVLGWQTERSILEELRDLGKSAR